MDNSSRHINIERKLELFRKRLIVCPYCPYNGKENGKRRPRDDKYKNHKKLD